MTSPSRPSKEDAATKSIQWTPEIMSKAAGLWRSGASAAVMAAQIGCTRSALLGKANRHRDIFPQRKIRTARGQSKSQKSGALKQGKPFTKTGPGMDKIPEDGKSPLRTARDLSQYRCEGQEPVVFTDLTSRQCHFPLSSFDEKDGPAMLCCGAAVLPGQSWCEAHRAVVYVKRVDERP